MNLTKKLAVLTLLLMGVVSSWAQCAMCAATLETTKEEGGITGAGINVGVAYLSFFPYLIIGVIGFIIYRKYKSDQNIDEQE